MKFSNQVLSAPVVSFFVQPVALFMCCSHSVNSKADVAQYKAIPS